MLEVTSAGSETNLKVNFTDVYNNSELNRLDSSKNSRFSHLYSL